jgi:uncharacterized protein
MHVSTRIKVFETGTGKHLLCNAITGEILPFTDRGLRLLEAIASGRADSCGADLMTQLKRKGILFESPEEEERAFVAVCQKGWRAFQRSAPRQYTFVINTHCNFQCPYCFEEAFEAPARTLTPSQVDGAFAVIDRLSGGRRKAEARYEIFGGEPLLPGSRSIVEYALTRIADRQGQASIQTNGYHLSDFVDLIAKFRHAISNVQVTLDGPRDIHDRRRLAKGGGPTFARIVSGIDALTDADLPVRIDLRMNVDRRNLKYLAEMAEVYQAHGWTKNPRFTFVAAPVDNRCGKLTDPAAIVGWDELFDQVYPLSTDTQGGPFDLGVFKPAGYFRYYMRTIRESMDGGPAKVPEFVPKALYCEAAGLKLFVFHPDGRIYPCPEAIGTTALAIGAYHPEFRIDRKRARQWKHQTVVNRERCRTCAISTFCGGGCVLLALVRNGTMSEPDCEGAGEVMRSYFLKLGAPGK